MEQHKEDRLTEDEVAIIKELVTEHVKEHMKGYMDGHMKHIVKNLYGMDQDPTEFQIQRYEQQYPKEYAKEFKKVFGKEWDREFNKVYKQQIRMVYMGQYMGDYELPKTHLVTGGYSRGAAVEEPAFLASLSAFSGTRLLKKRPISEEEAKNQVEGLGLEEPSQTSTPEKAPTQDGEAKAPEKEQVVDGSALFKKYFSKLSVIAVDPVPGLDQQDTFGLENMPDQENPLQEIFENLHKKALC